MQSISLRRRLLASLSLSALAGAGLVACSSNEDSGAEPAAESTDALTVVASTSVWADVAKAVLPDAEVSAVVEDSSIDPHSFEPSASDLAGALAADITVVGGGGYDAWMYETLVDEGKQNTIVHALPLIAHSHEHDHEEDTHSTEVEMVDGNEHIWFDVDAVSVVAEDLAAHAQELGPDAAADASDVVADMDNLRTRLKALPELNVAQTESIGDYLIDDSSLNDVTPEGYRHAILNHSSPAAADLAAFLEVIEAGDVDILLFNPQTATDQTERVRDAAEQAGATIIEVGEIPPTGTNFLDYFDEVVTHLENAAGAAS